MTSWKGKKKRVKRPGAEIAEFGRNSPALQTKYFNIKNEVVFAASHFQAEVHRENLKVPQTPGAPLSSCLGSHPVLGSK